MNPGSSPGRLSRFTGTGDAKAAGQMCPGRGIMKFLRGLILAGCLMFGGFVARSQQATQPGPKAPVEYNLSGCTPDGYVADHVLVFNGKFEYTHSLVAAGKVEKNSPDDDIVFDYKEEPVDKDGNKKFHAELVVNEHKVEINGFIRGEKLIGLVLVDGKLFQAIYGQAGTVEQMAKDHPGPKDDPDFQFCMELQPKGRDEVPQALMQWLKADKTQTN